MRDSILSSVRWEDHISLASTNSHGDLISIPLRLIFLLFSRNFFHADLHAISAERDILSLQLRPRVVTDVMCDRVCNESDCGDDCDEEEEDDQWHDGPEFGHGIPGVRR